jgi:hypothetical protein
MRQCGPRFGRELMASAGQLVQPSSRLACRRGSFPVPTNMASCLQQLKLRVNRRETESGLPANAESPHWSSGLAPASASRIRRVDFLTRMRRKAMSASISLHDPLCRVRPNKVRVDLRLAWHSAEAEQVRARADGLQCSPRCELLAPRPLAVVGAGRCPDGSLSEAFAVGSVAVPVCCTSLAVIVRIPD